MTAEPDLYPSDALADEEPRYLRRQKPLEVRRRRFGHSWPAYRRWMLVGTGVLVGGFILVQSARFFLFSPRLVLASYDQIEISGGQYVSRATVTDKFSTDLGKSVLRVPLDKRRAALEALPWVASANVERILPNQLRVELTERTPVAFLRSGSQLELLDADGIILDRPLQSDFDFPVVTGMDETMPQQDRRQRMQMFVEFLRAIDAARPGAGDNVSEVDLSDAKDLRATLAGLPGIDEPAPILVHFGDTDFNNRYRLLVENIRSWRSSVGAVESVDLRFSRQVVVNPESETRAGSSKSASVRNLAPSGLRSRRALKER